VAAAAPSPAPTNWSKSSAADPKKRHRVLFRANLLAGILQKKSLTLTN
jgi:hypothetical protein